MVHNTHPTDPATTYDPQNNNNNCSSYSSDHFTHESVRDNTIK